MLTIFKPKTLIIDHGRVYCPIQGDIDVERCVGCQWLRSARLGGQEPCITCQALERGYAGEIPL